MSPCSTMAGADLSSPSSPRKDSTGPFSLRKKTPASIRAVRSWLAVNSSGQSRLVQAGKRAIMMRTGLSARDLRILDPNLSHPFAILGRDRAIVINLEQIKAVVTGTEALVLNYSDPTVSPFLLRLQRRLSSRPDPQMEGDGNTNDDRNAYDLEDMKSSRSPPDNYGSADYTEEAEGNGKCQIQVDERGKSKMTGDLANSNSFKFLPFEFIVLEACLETACSCLEIEATTLENEAYPALDKLTTKISTLNLEHVRQIKSRLVAITGRVSKVRDELEHLLDDDNDMAEMYLTDKLLQQQSNGSSQCSHMNKVCSYKGKRIFANGSLGEYSVQNQCDNIISNLNLRDAFSSRSSSKRHHVEELEMLLEAYFVQIDSTLNKLSSLGEYVVDTENYINIMLDDKRNHLLQAGVVLMTATLIVSAFIILAAIFGMNIAVDLFDENKSGTVEFVWTVGGGATGSLLLYVVAVSWCKHRGLLE